MNYNYDAFNAQQARDAFEKARSRAFWRRLTRLHKNTELESFLQISRKAQTVNRFSSGIQSIPVDRIVGSVSENHSFDDCFNPRQNFSRDRWVSLYIATLKGEIIPPIEVYQLDDEYYIVDGHHRVSVAHTIGQQTIEAHVTTIKSQCNPAA